MQTKVSSAASLLGALRVKVNILLYYSSDNKDTIFLVGVIPVDIFFLKYTNVLNLQRVNDSDLYGCRITRIKQMATYNIEVRYLL